MLCLRQLPEEIIRLLQSFLSNDDYHYFMNTSKQCFGELKKTTIYFPLNEEYSLRYVEDGEFQSNLLARITNGWKQIGVKYDMNVQIPKNLPIHQLKCEYSSFDLIDVDHIESIHRVKVGEVVPPLPKVMELTLSNVNQLLDVRNLSHLHKLEIVCASKLTDIEPLKNIPDLSFHSCGIKDFSMLNRHRQKRLVIQGCPVTDVHSLGGLYLLQIAFCDHLEDVSPLKGVYDLEISFCKKVKDISGLGGHHRVEIGHCDVGLASLRGTRHITLNTCNITDSTIFQDAKSVTLIYCNNIDVSYLTNVKKLTIDRCSNLKNSLSLIKDVKDLTLGVNMAGIPLNNYRLSLLNFSVIDYNFLRNIQHLRLYGRRELSDLINTGEVSFFQHLQSLLIDDDDILERVNGLGNIPVLSFVCCQRLHDISGLGGNRGVTLTDCGRIQDVSSLATVPIVTIRGCCSIINYDCLSKVERLKVISLA